MGTDKRERQKANRQARLEEMAKEAQRHKTQRRAIQIGGLIAAAVVIALLFAVFGGGDDEDQSADTTVAAATDTTLSAVTTAPPTTPAPEPTVSAVSITGETPCPTADSPRTITFEQAPPMCIDPAKKYSATFNVALNGEPSTLTIELDAATAPTTVNNFVVLARYHYFDGTTCHRAVTGFVVQCGDPTATGSGGPGYEFEDELPENSDGYVKGAVAMANSGPGTNGSQFFFVTSDDGAAKLGPSYSLFGQVTDGLDSTLAGMADFATETELPSGLIQITSVEITES